MTNIGLMIVGELGVIIGMIVGELGVIIGTLWAYAFTRRPR